MSMASMKSCTLLAVSVDGKSVTTIEGLARTPMPICIRCSWPSPQSRPAVRLLHARHDHERGRFRQAERRNPPRAMCGTGSKAISAAAPAIRTSSRPCLPALPPCRPRQEADHECSHRHWRLDPAQGRPPVHHRQGQLRRRHQAAGYGDGRIPALAARARADQEHRHQGCGRAAWCRGDLHRRGPRRGQDRRSALRVGRQQRRWHADEGAAAFGDGGRQGAMRRRRGGVRDRRHDRTGARSGGRDRGRL